MIFLYAFLVSGIICAIAQIIMDYFKLTPAHITGLLVIIGAILDFFNIYDQLIKFSGAGALVPITSFGHSVVDSGLENIEGFNLLEFGSNMLSSTSLGITVAIFFAFLIALLFKPKG